MPAGDKRARSSGHAQQVARREAAVAAVAGGSRVAGGWGCGAPAARSRVQGFEHAFQGNLAVRGISDLADLIPVDRAGLEIEGEPAARTEVRRRVESLSSSSDARSSLSGLKMRPHGRSSIPAKTPKIFLPARNVGRPHASTSSAWCPARRGSTDDLATVVASDRHERIRFWPARAPSRCDGGSR